MTYRILALLVATVLSRPLAAQAPERVYDPGEVDTQPRVLNGAEFQQALAEGYPQALREAGTGGIVSVSFVVASDGSVQDARVVSSTDAALGPPSLAAAGVLRLAPATVGGRPVATRVELPIEWTAAPVARSYEVSEVEVAPRVLNGDQVRELLTTNALGLERVPGGGASTRVRLLVGTGGEVKAAVVTRSSGDPSFDAVVEAVALTQRHDPALIGGRPVEVWVEQPFQLELDRESTVVYRMHEEREGRPRLVNAREFNGMLYRRMPDWDAAAPLTFTVDLLVELDDRGRPSDFSLLRGSGQPRVDAAVLGAAPGLRFTPAVVDGRRVASTLYFQLAVEKPAESRNRERVTPPRHGRGIVPELPPPPPPSPR